MLIERESRKSEIFKKIDDNFKFDVLLTLKVKIIYTPYYMHSACSWYSSTGRAPDL